MLAFPGCSPGVSLVFASVGGRCPKDLRISQRFIFDSQDIQCLLQDLLTERKQFAPHMGMAVFHRAWLFLNVCSSTHMRYSFPQHIPNI